MSAVKETAIKTREDVSSVTDESCSNLPQIKILKVAAQNTET